MKSLDLINFKDFKICDQFWFMILELIEIIIDKLYFQLE